MIEILWFRKKKSINNKEKCKLRVILVNVIRLNLFIIIIYIFEENFKFNEM